MQWILFPTDYDQAHAMGGKARALAALSRESFPIPEWFVIRAESCLHSIGQITPQKLTEANEVQEIQKLLAEVSLNATLIAEIKHGLATLSTIDGLVAIRSSAIDEDGADHSFAGQLESYLFVSPNQVMEKIIAVWQSGFSDRILAYRIQHGMTPQPQPPAVLVQRMINATASGVAFSADPVSGRQAIAVVSAVFGLGTALVSGEANADTWHVDRSGKIIEIRIVEKQFAHRSAPESPEGIRIEALSSEYTHQAVLTEDQVRAIASLARQCASHFGRPQDIEWAIENGRVYLLQSRPITSLAGLADPDGKLNIWDNSNIAESYGGITTPLTYSFARRAYEEVYRQFCRLMVVPSSRIADNSQVFRCMIGLVRGRVYYNLLNWYRLLAMLPGFTVNRQFMEQMMGVKESLPEELVQGIKAASVTERIKDALNLVITIVGLGVNYFTLGSRTRNFYIRLNSALRDPDPSLEIASPDELAVYYQSLERQLLTRWDAPLVNDFFAMIFYGVLKKLSTGWCSDSEGSLQNNLLCGEGGIISAEPAQRVRTLAEVASKYPEFAIKLTVAPLEQILQELEAFPEFAALYHAYLEKFGDRCLDELKLESATLHDDPTALLRSIGHLALREKEPQKNLDSKLRTDAESRVETALQKHFLRRIIFRWVLKQTRSRVRDRENLRFERTRLFGRVRRIFIAMGRELAGRNIIKLPVDIFYLELDEILRFCDGTTSTTNLKALIALRQTEFTHYKQIGPPADRFETRGMVYHGNYYVGTPCVEPDSKSDDEWKGIGCCPGVVRGKVRVITDPRTAVIKPGEILVAERTDPGWIMLFASAVGLLVERGSILSHSAIVSREMGIPSIVSIPTITQRLKDGDWVEMNGSTGIVKRIQHD